jgi:hypothetical protein
VSVLFANNAVNRTDATGIGGTEFGMESLNLRDLSPV